MYLRPAFVQTDPGQIIGLIRANPFGILVSVAPRLDASHVPFMLRQEGEGFVLGGHLAAGNPQCACLDGGEALAVFTGPHAYISPSWYETQPAVPTWDYAAVHVYGTLRLVEAESEVAEILDALALLDPAGFRLAHLPADYRQRMLRGIRSFWLLPTRVETQWKMSQNRSVADRKGVIAALSAMSDPRALETAALIAQTLPVPAPDAQRP
jgi:transcriptional regulator